MSARPFLTDDLFHGADSIPIIDARGKTVALLDLTGFIDAAGDAFSRCRPPDADAPPQNRPASGGHSSCGDRS